MGSETDYGFTPSEDANSDAPATTADETPAANEPQQELVEGATSDSNTKSETSDNVDEFGREKDVPPFESPSATKNSDGSYTSRSGLEYTLDEKDGDRTYSESNFDSK